MIPKGFGKEVNRFSQGFGRDLIYVERNVKGFGREFNLLRQRLLKSLAAQQLWEKFEYPPFPACQGCWRSLNPHSWAHSARHPLF